MKKEIKFVDSNIFLEIELTEDSKVFAKEADRVTFNYAVSSMIITSLLKASGQNLYQNLHCLLKKFINDTETEIRRFSSHLSEPTRKDARYNFSAQEIREPLPFNELDLSLNTYVFSYELLTDTFSLEFDLCKIYFVIKECFELRNIKNEFPDFITSIFEHNPELYKLLGGRVIPSDPESVRRRFENLSKALSKRINQDPNDQEEFVRKIRRKKQPV